MIIGVISDTHKHIHYIDKAMEKLRNVDMIIHLGDNISDVKEMEKKYKGKIISVNGNCDFNFEGKDEIIMEIENKKVLITHGHHYGVKESLLRLRYRAEEIGADLVLYGHTHISKIDFENGIFFVNPGSPALPKNGVNAVARIDISTGKIIPFIIEI